MKFTDNYGAKYEIWAGEGKVYALPKMRRLPHFGWRKFDSYEAFNAWKRQYLQRIAAEGGVEWTK